MISHGFVNFWVLQWRKDDASRILEKGETWIVGAWRMVLEVWLRFSIVERGKT